MEYRIEETIARIETMPWPRRGKDIMSFALRSGRLPASLDHEGPGSADDDDPDAEDE